MIIEMFSYNVMCTKQPKNELKHAMFGLLFIVRVFRSNYKKKTTGKKSSKRKSFVDKLQIDW